MTEAISALSKSPIAAEEVRQCGVVMAKPA